MGGGGLPVCNLLSLEISLKMYCTGLKDELVSELASIYTIYLPPNYIIIGYHIIIFTLCLESRRSGTAG